MSAPGCTPWLDPDLKPRGVCESGTSDLSLQPRPASPPPSRSRGSIGRCGTPPANASDLRLRLTTTRRMARLGDVRDTFARRRRISGVRRILLALTIALAAIPPAAAAGDR